MRKSNEVLFSHIRFDADGYLMADYHENGRPVSDSPVSNFGGITIAVKFEDPLSEENDTFVVAYSKANTGSPSRKPENFCRGMGRQIALQHLNEEASNQRFTFIHHKPVAELQIREVIAAARSLVLQQQIGDNTWLVEDTKNIDVTLPWAVSVSEVEVD